jgi:polyferredoxin
MQRFIPLLLLATFAFAVALPAGGIGAGPLPWSLAAAAGILLVQGGLALVRGPLECSPRRRDLLAALPRLRRILVHPATRPIAQALFGLLFLALIGLGLLGSSEVDRNPVPHLTWSIWWGGILLAALVAGKAWCYVCPWEAVAGWIENPTLRPDAPGLGLRRRWPRGWRHLWLAVALLVLLTGIELLVRVEESPRATAAIGIAMVTVTLLFTLVFERRAFCRHVCSVGGITGLTSLLSPTEVRPAEAELCIACRTKDCFHGNQWGTACPTSLFPASLTENTHCIVCLECIKTCPLDTMTLRVRPAGLDLFELRNPRLDEAALALTFLALALLRAWLGSEGGEMLLEDLATALGSGRGLAVTVAIAAALGGTAAGHAAVSGLVVRLASPSPARFGSRFVALAYALIPLALVLELARILGTLAIFAEPHLWILQVLLVALGQSYAVRAVSHRLRREPGETASPLAARLLATGAVLTLGILSLWILVPTSPS